MRTIFVFGSNTQGRHGKGAALTAFKHFGAIYGQARGLQGDSYAIVTKELRPDYEPIILGEVDVEVADFIRFAQDHPEMEFLVPPIGTGLAGFTIQEIAPLFKLPFDRGTENIRLCVEIIRELQIQRGDKWVSCVPFNPLDHEQTK